MLPSSPEKEDTVGSSVLFLIIVVDVAMQMSSVGGIPACRISVHSRKRSLQMYSVGDISACRLLVLQMTSGGDISAALCGPRNGPRRLYVIGWPTVTLADGTARHL